MEWFQRVLPVARGKRSHCKDAHFTILQHYHETQQCGKSIYIHVYTCINIVSINVICEGETQHVYIHMRMLYKHFNMYGQCMYAS